MSLRIVLSALQSKTDLTQIIDALTKLSGAKALASLGVDRGIPYEVWHADSSAALVKMLNQTREAGSFVVEGVQHLDVPGSDEFGFDADLAANLSAPLFAVVRSEDVNKVWASAQMSYERATKRLAKIGAVIALGIDEEPAKKSPVPIIAARNLSPEQIAQRIIDLAAKIKISAITPLAFQLDLMDKARQNRKTIVLPESEDDRILEAADKLLKEDVANLILLGEKPQVEKRAQELGLDLSKARIISLNDPELSEKYATAFYELRKAKGVTLEQARQTLQDVSYFGTMMVYLGDADGMVSGAAHTTAHTIRPSFQTIKTKPGSSVVSSVFLMLMKDHVLVFGDCAVNPNPTAQQLAEIAIISAQTAKQFGVDPKVAMISYSTGTSGSGPDVELVTQAVALAKQMDPTLAVDGPLQFDAAYDPTVGKSKMPGSPVAGQATVFIFPDLNTGNCTYKAVQRTSGAVAVGPILQGLNKPVNDLSRGALVEDIVNTVVITAVQAAE